MPDELLEALAIEADDFEDEHPLLADDPADENDIPDDGIPTPLPPPSPKSDEVPLTADPPVAPEPHN